MSSLFDSGIRPAIDQYLLDEAAKVRDYGSYWSASSAGYCMRRNVFERLKVPHSAPEDARKQRVFTAGHVFHDWIQEITKASGQSIAQEVELQDEDLMVRGHFDDLVLIKGGEDEVQTHGGDLDGGESYQVIRSDKLILYDYKTQNSRAFTYQKGKPMSYYHKLQLGTYMYMLRQEKAWEKWSKVRPQGSEYDHPYKLMSLDPHDDHMTLIPYKDLTEARILKISKDDLRMDENQLLWSEELSSEVRDYWTTLNKYWADKKIPPCTCADHEGGFLAKEAYNPYFFEGEPCSLEYYEKMKEAA